MLNRSPGNGDRVGRAGHIGDGEAEFACAARQSLNYLVETFHPTEGVKEVIHLLGVIEALALGGLGADLVQPGQRISLTERQIDVHERVPVTRCNSSFIAVVQADRHLCPQVGAGRVVG